MTGQELYLMNILKGNLAANNQATKDAAAANALPTTTPNEIRLYVVSVVKTFTCMSQYNEMLHFFNDAAHTQATFDAYTAYGKPPANGIDGAGNYHPNWCSWDLGIYKFYLAAKLFYRYPAVNTIDKNNCQKIKELSAALEVEKLNADKQFTADNDTSLHSYQLYVINDLQGNLNAAFANMSCSLVLQQTQQQQTLTAIATATNESEAATTNSTSNKGIYVVAAVLIVVIIIKIFKS